MDCESEKITTLVKGVLDSHLSAKVATLISIFLLEVIVWYAPLLSTDSTPHYRWENQSWSFVEISIAENHLRPREINSEINWYFDLYLFPLLPWEADQYVCVYFT